MSRMTKYLKQVAMWEQCSRNAAGEVQLNEYGEPIFGPPIRIRCRVEPYSSRATTGTGQYVNFTSTYYVDDSTHVRNSDRLDGQEVQRVNEYHDGAGTLVGFEVQV